MPANSAAAASATIDPRESPGALRLVGSNMVSLLFQNVLRHCGELMAVAQGPNAWLMTRTPVCSGECLHQPDALARTFAGPSLTRRVGAGTTPVGSASRDRARATMRRRLARPAASKRG